MMTYAIPSGAVMGAAQFNESQLDRLTRKLRNSFRNAVKSLEAICKSINKH